MSRPAVLLFAALLLPAAVYAEPATQPTSAPATRPAAVDLSSPKATLVSLGDALERNDPDAVAACFLDPAARPLYRKLTPLMSPSYKLDALMRQKFGEGLEAVPNGTALFRADHIDAAETKRDGERATVTFFEVQDWPLRRVEGRWLIDTADGEGGAAMDPKEVEDMAEMMLAMAKESLDPINAAVGEAIKGIESGRLASRDSVLRELDEKVGLPVVGDGR